MAKARSAQPIVMVVAGNHETLDGLRAYFTDSGVPALGVCSIRDLAFVTQAARAVVLFPDEFEPSDVNRLVPQLRSARPTLALVVVTREAQRFEAALAPNDRSVAPIVLPKPAFGWSILDAIRAHWEGRE